MGKPVLRTTLLVLALSVVWTACNVFNKAPDDSAITADIEAKLYQDPTLKTRDIKVDTQKGVVVLSGTVNADSEKTAAETIANHVPGVKQVIDQLSVTAQQAAAMPVAAPPAPEPASPPPAPRRARHHHVAAAPDRRVPAGASAAPQPPAASEPTPAPVVERPPATDSRPVEPPPPQTVTIPAGTVVTVRMIDSIDSKTSQPGQQFAASVAAPVVAGDKVVIPQGANATIRLVSASQSGKFEGRPELKLELASLSANGTTYSVTSGYYVAQGNSRGKRTAEAIGGGSALGAIIGAIAGGRKGAAIGAGAGAAAGTGVEAASGRTEVKIPSETKIDFTLKAPLVITLSR
jgi:hypothetical protein